MVIAPIRWSGEVFVHFATKTGSSSPLRVRASIMILAEIPSRAGFLVSVFGLRFPFLLFPVIWLDRIWVFALFPTRTGFQVSVFC